MREDYYNNIPASELNPNHKEDFEKLLTKVVTTTAPPVKKKERKK